MISWIIIHCSLFIVVGLSLIIIISTFLGFKQLVTSVSCGRREILIICLIVLASWMIRQFLISHMHNVYLDEFSHMQLAQNILHTGNYGFTQVAGDFKSPVTFAVKWPPAFHTFLAGAYAVLGTKESTAYALNAIFGAMGVFGAWFYIRMMSFSASTSLLTAVLVALWPIHLRISAGASLEPGAMALILISSAFTAAYLKTRSTALFWAAAAAIGLSGMFRLEGAAAAAMVPVTLIILEDKNSFRQVRLKLTQYIGIGIFLVPVLLFAVCGFNEYRLFRSGNEGLHFFGGLSFWFGGGLMPFSYTVLMLTGLIYLMRKRISLAITCTFTMLAMLLIYSLYIRVDASLSDLQRYQLLCAPGFLGLAAAAFQWGEDIKKKFPMSQIVIIAFVITGLLPSLPRAQEPFQEKFEQKYRFIVSSSALLPEDAMYFAAAPQMLSTVLNVQCFPVHWLLDDNVNMTFGQNKTKILFRDIWSSSQDQTDQKIRQNYILRPIIEKGNTIEPVGFYEIIERND